GILNLGIPSIVVKMLRQKFDQQWSVRKAHSTEADHQRLLQLVRRAKVRVDTRLEGPTLRMDSMLAMKAGDVLALDYPLDRPLDVTVNGKLKFRGEMVEAHRKRAVRITELVSGH